MADIQVPLHLYSNKEHSKSKTMYSSTAKNCLPKRHQVESDTTKMSVLDSKLPKKPSKAITSIRNVLSLAMSQSEAKF